jgi:hypothetical protein
LLRLDICKEVLDSLESLLLQNPASVVDCVRKVTLNLRRIIVDGSDPVTMLILVDDLVLQQVLGLRADKLAAILDTQDTLPRAAHDVDL